MIQQSSNHAYKDQIKDLQHEVFTSKLNEQKLKIELEQVKFQSKEKDLKIELISNEIELSQDEGNKAKTHLEAANIRIRGLIDECEQVERSK